MLQPQNCQFIHCFFCFFFASERLSVVSQDAVSDIKDKVFLLVQYQMLYTQELREQLMGSVGPPAIKQTCRYGSSCYRENVDHLSNYRHLHRKSA